MVRGSRVAGHRTGQFELHLHTRRAPTGDDSRPCCRAASARGPDAFVSGRFSTRSRAKRSRANVRGSDAVSSADACGHLLVPGVRAGLGAGSSGRIV